eukprot:TRINITY_DN2450_c0_g1_i3.p1 TRINITY_DN2450_c0_g1~~TRINITY_DN2450_c0_g1_i3.p1  ORF type:complete len:500 (-),score=57.75 TRINITY_DN2450_c0_g1_i3:1522-2967(-)
MTHRWIPLQSLPIPSACHASVVHRDRILVFCGGGGDMDFKNHIMSYGLASQQWELIAAGGQPPPPSHTPTIAKHNSAVFLFGGRQGHVATATYYNDTFRLDLDSMAWTRLQCTGAIPPPRNVAASTVFNDSLIVFGGVGPEGESNDVFALDLTSFAWTAVRTTGSVPPPRAGHAYARVGDCLYCFGGNAKQGDFAFFDSVHFLDLRTMAWTQVGVDGLRPPGLAGHSAVTYGDSIYIFGGWNQSPARQYFNQLWKFIPGKGRFKVVAYEGQPPPVRSAHTAVVVHQNLYVIGGWSYDTVRHVLGDLYSLSLPPLVPKSQFGADLARLCGAQQFSDCTLVAEGQRFAVHRNILSVRCPYFNAMFSGGMREMNMSEVPLMDVSASALVCVLKFIYTDVAEVSANNAAEVLVLAGKYGLARLQSLCESQLANNLDHETVLPVTHFFVIWTNLGSNSRHFDMRWRIIVNYCAKLRCFTYCRTRTC